MWQLEIEQLQRFLSAEEFMGWNEMQLWNKITEEERLSYVRANDKTPDVDEVLETGLALCRASQETGNPIEFSLWQTHNKSLQRSAFQLFFHARLARRL